MARITVTNATIVKVWGDFNDRLNIEEYVDGLSWPKKYTIWGAESKYSVGDIITVEGDLSTKGRIYENQGEKKATVDVGINHPRITVIGTTQTAPATYTVDEAAQMLANAPAVDNGAPF